MGLDATARRRWLGAFVLVAALGMLVAGETLLKGRLSALAFLIYWLICLAFTGVAILVAYVDARALRDHVRQQHHDLLQNTLKDIETDAKNKQQHDNQSQRPNLQ